MPQGETLKPQEDGIKKVVQQSGYQFKKYRTQPAKMSSKTPLYV
jgi:hypothetical protein